MGRYDRRELVRQSRPERRFPFTLRVAVCHDGEAVRSAAGPLRPAA